MKVFENGVAHFGDALETVKQLQTESIDSIITSPPYYQLRDYGFEGQWGSEVDFRDYLDKMVLLMIELKRVLKPTGTMWVNLGDTYGTFRGKSGQCPDQAERNKNRGIVKNIRSKHHLHRPNKNQYDKSLMLIPHRFAIRCIDELGLKLRNDIIWAKCLSGGTMLYAKTLKGIFPQSIKDLSRLNNVELWTGEKWSKVMGFYKNQNFSNPLEIILQSGEKIACTKEHKFPTTTGLKVATELKPGDVLLRVKLPDNEPKDDLIDSEIVAWFVGLYLAEGSLSGEIIQIASHSKETNRLEKCKLIAKMFDGTCRSYVKKNSTGNSMTINMSGQLLIAIIEKFIAGYTCYKKHLSTDAWQRSNRFLDTLLKSYLEADAHFEKNNNRWRLGFSNNPYLVNDLRTICARLEYKIKLSIHHFKSSDGKLFKGYRGEIRFIRSNHFNNQQREKIVAINKSNGRSFWDIEIKDEPHLFALSTGILTHNSHGMPESVTDRFTKMHEFIFFFVKQKDYYFNLDGIRDPLALTSIVRLSQDVENQQGSTRAHGGRKLNGTIKACAHKNGKNPGDVADFWAIDPGKTTGNHFAIYSSELIKKPIIAGSPEGGIILDPFGGTGTTAFSSIRHGRKFIYIDGSQEYYQNFCKEMDRYDAQLKIQFPEAI